MIITIVLWLIWFFKETPLEVLDVYYFYRLTNTVKWTQPNAWCIALDYLIEWDAEHKVKYQLAPLKKSRTCNKKHVFFVYTTGMKVGFRPLGLLTKTMEKYILTEMHRIQVYNKILQYKGNKLRRYHYSQKSII